MNGREYSETEIERIRKMTPSQRLEMAFELTRQARERARDGIRRCYPKATEAEVDHRFRDRLMPAYYYNEPLDNVLEEMAKLPPDA